MNTLLAALLFLAAYCGLRVAFAAPNPPAALPAAAYIPQPQPIDLHWAAQPQLGAARAVSDFVLAHSNTAVGDEDFAVEMDAPPMLSAGAEPRLDAALPRRQICFCCRAYVCQYQRCPCSKFMF